MYDKKCSFQHAWLRVSLIVLFSPCNIVLCVCTIVLCVCFLQTVCTTCFHNLVKIDCYDDNYFSC